MQEERLTIATSHGKLDATLLTPEHPTHALLLAHGAGADHRHAHMTSLAQAFQSVGITTLRFNFPFKQAGKSRVDSKSVSTDCIIEAAAALKDRVTLPLLAGGHSFGGRMATHAVAECGLKCDAMVLCSFPLHAAGKPSVERAAHLKDVDPPMLFLNGTRDTLSDQTLLNQELTKLAGNHQIHWLDTGDHSYKILKRSRKSSVDIYIEAAQAARAFIDSL